ncbi:uncharacterized protein ARMOST_20971 [Armillaria ostoyae]|uniref:Uncharacterized protein n=1 Tax=Armillaria ostoyae TaxID=47428 RepID=A0A284S8U1_ARMOS|nr:uncharacterized protein ARMOST_20971 [Armillaria ostoyae]
MATVLDSDSCWITVTNTKRFSYRAFLLSTCKLFVLDHSEFHRYYPLASSAITTRFKTLGNTQAVDRNAVRRRLGTMTAQERTKIRFRIPEIYNWIEPIGNMSLDGIIQEWMLTSM